jgi:hypothetical protein
MMAIVNVETLMRTNDMSGGERGMVEKTKSYLKKNSVAYINGMFLYSYGYLVLS